MPFTYDPNLKKEDEDQQLASGASEVKLAGGSSSNEQSANNPTSPSSGGSANKGLNTGSGFQNIDKYLSVNDAPKFGNQFVGNVENTINSAKNNQESATNEFKNRVNSANYIPDQFEIDQALSDPTHANQDQFRGWMTKGYQGPSDLTQSQDIWNQYWSGTKKAQNEANQLGTESGRFALLDNYYGRPQYGFGEKSLDNQLIQKSGIGQKANDLQNQAVQLNTQGQEQANKMRDLATARTQEVNQSRDNVNNAFNTALGNAQKEVTDSVTKANQDRTNQYQDFMMNLNNGTLEPGMLTALGLGAGDKLYNLNLNDYFTKGADLGVANVMTPEQKARIQALDQLSNNPDTFSPSEVGQKGEDPFTFLKDNFRTAQGAAQGEYTQKANQALNDIFQSPGTTFSPEQLLPGYWQDAMNAPQPRGVTLNKANYQKVIDALTQLNQKYGIGRTAGHGNLLAPAQKSPVNIGIRTRSS